MMALMLMRWREAMTGMEAATNPAPIHTYRAFRALYPRGYFLFVVM